MKKRNIVILSFLIFMISLFISPNIVFAGTHPSGSGGAVGGGGGGTGNGVAGAFVWKWTDDQGYINSMIGSNGKLRVSDRIGGGTYVELGDDDIPPDSIAVLTSTKYKGEIISGYVIGRFNYRPTVKNQYKLNDYWIDRVPRVVRMGDKNTNWVGWHRDIIKRFKTTCSYFGCTSNLNEVQNEIFLPVSLVDVATNDGYVQADFNGFNEYRARYKKNGKVLSIVWKANPWAHGEKREDRYLYIPIVDEDRNGTPLQIGGECKTGYLCTSSVGGPNPNGTTFDPNGSDKELWDYAGNKMTFEASYVSKEGEKEFRHDYDYKIIKVTKITTWEYRKTDPNDIKPGSENVNYVSETIGTKHIDADWTYEPDKTSYVKLYNPWDMNKESVVTNYPFSLPGNVKGNLNLQVDSELDPLLSKKPAIDNNSEVGFTTKFSNEQFGIPTAAQGGFDLHDKYYEGGAEVQYYAPKVYIGLKEWPGLSNQASLQIEGEQEFNTQTILPGVRIWNYRWLFRSLKTGDYHLGSTLNPDYWMLSYKTNLRYKYGASYHFKITINTTNGNIISATGFTDNNYNKATVNGEELYTDNYIQDIEQPLLRGIFNVKTVGGYKPNK